MLGSNAKVQRSRSLPEQALPRDARRERRRPAGFDGLVCGGDAQGLGARQGDCVQPHEEWRPAEVAPVVLGRGLSPDDDGVCQFWQAISAHTPRTGRVHADVRSAQDGLRGGRSQGRCCQLGVRRLDGRG